MIQGVLPNKTALPLSYTPRPSKVSRQHYEMLKMSKGLAPLQSRAVCTAKYRHRCTHPTTQHLDTRVCSVVLQVHSGSSSILLPREVVGAAHAQFPSILTVASGLR